MKRRVLSRLTDTFILPHNGIDLIVFPELYFHLFFSTHTSNHIHSALFSLIQFFFTYTGATQADYGQRLQDSRGAHNPCETEEEDDAQDVLQAGQVDAHEGPHLRALSTERQTA